MRWRNIISGENYKKNIIYMNAHFNCVLNKMEKFWIFILVSFFATNSLEKAESVQLEELPLKIIDEIFGEGWWDNDKAEEWHKLTLEENALHKIDRQNTQIGQIELNSTDQLGQIEPNSTDQLGQIEPNSIDQNPPLTESTHSDINENIAVNEQKRKIIDKFHAIKEEFKQKGKYSSKERVQIEVKIAKHLKNRKKIFEWKKELALSRRNPKNERKNLIKKFDQIKAELTRVGFKNSYNHEIDETVAKELGISFMTIYNWKRELGQTKPKHKLSHSEQKELMKRYYKIKDKNPKVRDVDIAKMLDIGIATLYNWKRQFKRQQFHQNSVDGHFVENNVGSNVQ